MVTREIKKYLKNRSYAISLILKRPAKGFSQETFHKLRVEIKKLSALCDLISFSVPGFKYKKAFVPVRKIFDKAGRVRELQLQESILRKYLPEGDDPWFLQRISKRRKRQEKTFFTHLSPELPGKLKILVTRTGQAIPALNRKRTEKYFKRYSDEIRELLSSGSFRVEDLHPLRKKLKILNYNLKAFQDPEDLLGMEKDTLTPLLGTWHDNLVVIGDIESLADFGKRKSLDTSQLESIHYQLYAENKEGLEKIRVEIEKYGYPGIELQDQPAVNETGKAREVTASRDEGSLYPE